jgi:dethiobiotin synthetase
VNGYFITGTDTECGKTEITLGVMQWLQSQQLNVAGMKPIASGCEVTTEGLRNDDADRILKQSSGSLTYSQINCYSFQPAIAPHIAAAEAAVDIDFEVIKRAADQLSQQSDRLVIEGVGGWRVPLGRDGALSDLALALDLPVILVVGLKLGCINHALLTAESIQASGGKLVGWVGNHVEASMSVADENIQTLRSEIAVPCFGIVPNLAKPTAEEIAKRLDLNSRC